MKNNRKVSFIIGILFAAIMIIALPVSFIKASASEKGSKGDYEYEYDEHGNVSSLLRYQTKEGKRVLMEEYTFEYEEYTY